jgi:hypothetical protein
VSGAEVGTLRIKPAPNTGALRAMGGQYVIVSKIIPALNNVTRALFAPGLLKVNK